MSQTRPTEEVGLLSTPDYPAAHSMDTTWFAVDRQGHVGVFKSGEEGPVPKTCGRSGDQLIDKLRHLNQRSEMVFDVAACLHILNGRWIGQSSIREASNSYPLQSVRRNCLGRVLMFVESIDVVEPDLKAGQAIKMPRLSDDGPRIVLFPDLRRTSAERILRSGRCLSCCTYQEGFWTAIGIYDYRYVSKYGYFRDLVPQTPAQFHHLSRQLQLLIGGARFNDITFRETRFLQPAEFVPCQWYTGLQNEPAILNPDGSFRSKFDPEDELQQDRQKLQQDRQKALQALTSWPDPVITDPWAKQLILSIEDYREQNPCSQPEDIVRVALDFGSEDLAYEAYVAIRQDLQFRDGALRGSCLVFRDRGICGELDKVYQWLGQEIGAGRFRKLELAAGRPATQPSAEEFRKLRQQMDSLANRYMPENANAALDALNSGGSREVVNAILSLVLRLAEANGAGDRSDFYTYGVKNLDIMNPISRLSTRIRKVALHDWWLLEELVKYLPFFVEIADLRLRMLTILAEQGKLPAEELRRSLLAIFEDRDDCGYPWCESDLWINMLSRVLDSAVLPSDVLRQTIRASVIDAEMVHRRGWEKRGSVNRCRELLQRLENTQ